MYLILAKTLLDLELIRKNIFNNTFISKRLCNCKKEIVERYIYTINNLIIKLYTHILEQKPLDIKELKVWYNNLLYKQLYNQEFISNRIIYVIEEIDKENNIIFDKIQELCNIYKQDRNEEMFFNNLIGFFKFSIDLYIFNIIGFNIDCKNIKIPRELDNEFCLNECFKKQECLEIHNIHNTDEVGCLNHRHVETNGEFVHLIFIPEFILTHNCDYFKNYIHKIIEVHKNVKNVTLIFDFKLIKNNKELLNIVKEKLILCLDTIFNYFETIYIINDNKEIYNIVKDFFLKNGINIYDENEFILSKIHINFYM